MEKSLFVGREEQLAGLMDQLKLASSGSAVPRDSSGTSAGTARNRRVEILVRK